MFLYKLEKKYGKYAIKNLPLVIMVCFGIGYLLYGLLPNVTMMLDFSPPDIIYRHQYWRLFTWILSPAGSIDILALLMLFFYYTFAVSIERGIGTFLFNVYILGGWLFNTVFALILSIYYYFTVQNEAAYTLMFSHAGIGMMQYMQYSLFLGFALIYADSVVMLYFVIPFKASWIAYLDMAFLAIEFVSSLKQGYIYNCSSIVAYLVNFFVLFLIMRRSNKHSTAKMKRMRAYEAQMKNAETIRRRRMDDQKTEETNRANPVGITRHKCAICGRSEKDDISLEFRFCSKCKGNYEYCNEHLFTHEHIKQKI